MKNTRLPERKDNNLLLVPIKQVNNATYSSESQNVYCNENLDLKSDNEGNRAVYSVARRISKYNVP
jgi:hypothetical protein